VIELIPVTLAIAKQAALIAAEHRIRGCDSVYVALADQLSDALVTLEKQQLVGGGNCACSSAVGADTGLQRSSTATSEGLLLHDDLDQDPLPASAVKLTVKDLLPRAKV